MTAVKKGLDKLLAVLLALLFGALTLVVIWQVFARQVLKSAPAWTGELANYLFVWTSLIGMAFVFGERGHMAVTFAAERFPKAVRYVVAVIIQLIIIVFAVMVLIIGGARSAENAWLQNSVSLPLNIGWTYTILPISGVFMVFYAVYHMIEDLQSKGPLTVEDPTKAGEPELPVIADETVVSQLTDASDEEPKTKLDELVDKEGDASAGGASPDEASDEDPTNKEGGR